MEFAKGPINPLPAAVPQRLSDLIFLVWQNFCQAANPKVDVSSLKYIIHRMVSNPYTESIAEQAVQAVGSSVRAWPGTVLSDATQDPFKAIVGSPNGYGIGYLLASHHSIFGTKTYTDITVFNDAYSDLGILFTLGSPPSQRRDVDSESVLEAFAPDTLSVSATKADEPWGNDTLSEGTADPSAYAYSEGAWLYGEA